MSMSFLARRQSWVRNHFKNLKRVFISDGFSEFERSIRMGPVDFIASLGGLFGLCLGFSIVSFIEIVYWAVTGFTRNMFLRNREKM